jgi:hypothetical protein
MPVSSSSSSPSALFAVDLHGPDNGKTFPAFIVTVDIPMNPQSVAGDAFESTPALLIGPAGTAAAGLYYVWSPVRGVYVQQVPFAAPVDTGRPRLSVVCNPQV